MEIASMMAPRPMIMISATGDWTKNNRDRRVSRGARDLRALRQGGERGDDAPGRAAQLQPGRIARRSTASSASMCWARRMPPNSRRRSIRLEKLQDMLALHNRKLPDNALDYDGVFAQWVRTAQALVRRDHGPGAVARDDGVRAGRGMAGAGGAARPMARRLLFGRPGRGDRVAGILVRRARGARCC